MSRVILVIGLFALAITEAPETSMFYPPLTGDACGHVGGSVWHWTGSRYLPRPYCPAKRGLISGGDLSGAPKWPRISSADMHDHWRQSLLALSPRCPEAMAANGGSRAKAMAMRRERMNGRIGTGFNARDSGSENFYLAEGTWVRNFGEASRRGEEKISEVQAANK